MKFNNTLRQTFLAGVSSAAMIIALFGETSSAIAQVACMAGLNANACTVAQGANVGGTILTNGNGFTVDNAGTVTGGIGTFDDNSGVANTGSVGDFIRTNGNNSSIINSGNVVTGLFTAQFVSVTNSNIINLGNVGGSIAAGDSFFPLLNSNIINSGNVTGLIRIAGTNINITNSGYVGIGIFAFGTNMKVTNSGTVAGDITMGSIDPTLTLLPGSRIFGSISMSGVGAITLNVGNGLNLMATFLAPPNVINSSGQPFVLFGNQVAVLDPTAFSLQDEMLADLTGGIFGGLYARLAGVGGGGGLANSFASLSQLSHSTNIVPTAGGLTTSGPATSGQGFWMQGIFGYRSAESNGISNGGESTNVGAMAGVDAWLTDGLLAGVFGGYNHGELQTAFKAQKIETDSYFGGAYAHFQQPDWFANLMLTAGVSDHDSNRQVATNNQNGGVVSAKADYKGTFISPEISLGTTIDLGGLQIQPSARLRYAHIWLGKFSESGSASNLTIKKRNVSLFSGRAQIAVPIIPNLTPRIGVEAWTANNKKVSGTLLGQNISLNPGGRDNEVTFFAGATVAGKLTANISAFIDGEFHVDTHNNSRAQGSAGLTVHF